jgi:hypothetical protein
MVRVIGSKNRVRDMVKFWLYFYSQNKENFSFSKMFVSLRALGLFGVNRISGFGNFVNICNFLQYFRSR